MQKTYSLLTSLILISVLAVTIPAYSRDETHNITSHQPAAAAVSAEQVLFLGPLPALASDRLDVSGKAAESRQQLLRLIERQGLPHAGEGVQVFGQTISWRALSVDDAAQQGPGIWFLQLHTPQFVQGNVLVEGLKSAQLFVNFNTQRLGAELPLATGVHQLLIFNNGQHSDQKPTIRFKPSQAVTVQFSQLTKEPVNNRLLTNAETVNHIALSANAELVLLSFSGRSDASDLQLQRTELRNRQTNQILRSWPGQTLSRAAFSPDNQWLSYIANNTLWLVNLDNGEIRGLLENQSGVGAYRWLPDSQSIVLQWTQTDTSLRQAKAKVYREPEDRWRNFRDISRLFQLDIQSGLVRLLTADTQTSALLDIRPDGQALLFSQRRFDRTNAPHASTAVFELNLADLSQHEIGTFSHLNQVSYYRDQLLVVGGPNFAGGAGVNLPAGYQANDYDGQLYLMARDGQGVRALSKNFDPSISRVMVNRRQQVLIEVNEGDRSALYWLDVSRGRFEPLVLGLDVIEQAVLADDRAATVLARGTRVDQPQQVKSSRLGQRQPTTVHNSAKQYQHIQLGEVRDFNVMNPEGDRIEGRFYLPPDFDANKRYPAIVYYYGGTTTVNRQFTGRYPFHHWAANGYIVYVVQPRGTIGYGQRFSALHVNAWGKYTADDIIFATEQFVAAHPFVDAKRLGNIGASYGGFMTMYLATQTDLFAASISHAGISALSSYWGQGWWGFLYSGIASRDSFPWNNPELYVGQSPLYMADKITTPLLLITGDSDVNVPAGESQQMYTALKLLGREVALVTIPGEDHHIIDREKRYVWWDHLLAWFDRHLKDQPEWWQYLAR